MTLFLWFGAFLLAVIALLLVRKYTSIEFVDHAAQLHKTWSVRINAAAFTLGGWLVAFPDSAMHAWAILPPDIKSILPPNVMQIISYVLIGASVLSQYVRQNKLNPPEDPQQ